MWIWYFLKRSVRVACLLGRRVTSVFRVLPDFLIIGVMKGGATTLHSQLCQHPQILGGFKKEAHFFNGRRRLGLDSYAQGIPFYRAYFPLKISVGAGQRVCDATPSYLSYPEAAERIKKHLPNAPMIVLLRNPTERAISNYFHQHRLGHERRPIEEALSVEAFFSDPLMALGKMYRFLGVDSTVFPKDLRACNVSENRVDVSPDVYAALNDFYRPHNEALYELLGEDFGW